MCERRSSGSSWSMRSALWVRVWGECQGCDEVRAKARQRKPRTHPRPDPPLTSHPHPTQDNQHVLDLIQGRPGGLLALLDEASNLGSTDAAALTTFHSTFTDKKKAATKYKAYTKPVKSADRTFILTHYAGAVTYTIEGFIEKNKDELSADLTELLTQHSNLEQVRSTPAHLSTPRFAPPSWPLAGSPFASSPYW